ncbi:hypothetical protein Pcinc_003379 [Petrolisthes cinctipes]|uniref:Uncharacterized protein n=1 Tax=Petrolisthes cinctipes TaxID=88211 RepID=A0AAE1L185_PETCI|nr:hypothetical protein Pcinc_003350 [Petrolisthes cinctipes]KAK3892791.1 hypothetical protein Pcinc_003379 [Petrolisthes cinctipes]
MELQKKLAELQSAYKDAEEDWNHTDFDAELRTMINSAFEEMMTQYNNPIIRSNQKKLVSFNGGSLKYPKPSKGYINLTNKTLTADQEEILNYGLNCHVMS